MSIEVLQKEEVSETKAPPHQSRESEVLRSPPHAVLKREFNPSLEERGEQYGQTKPTIQGFIDTTLRLMEESLGDKDLVHVIRQQVEHVARATQGNHRKVIQLLLDWNAVLEKRKMGESVPYPHTDDYLSSHATGKSDSPGGGKSSYPWRDEHEKFTRWPYAFADPTSKPWPKHP